MGRMKTNKSKVVTGQSKSLSLRTTIPSNVAEQLGLSAGDTLDWKIDKIDDSWVATFRKD